MRTICVWEGPAGVPTLWRCWTDWRQGRRGPWRVRLADPLPVQCASCWGQRRIWEHGSLGMVPVVCDGCQGRGHLAS